MNDSFGSDNRRFSESDPSNTDSSANGLRQASPKKSLIVRSNNCLI